MRNMRLVRRGRAAHFAGLAAEEIVARLYERNGAAVLATRWRCPEGEIDLVVRTEDVIAFVEVKAGKSAVTRDVIGRRQWRRLEAAAERYRLEHQTGDGDLRFDVAFVGPDGEVNLVENARGFEAW